MCPRPLQVKTWTATQSGLVTWTFWHSKWCGMSAVARTAFLPVFVSLYFCDFRLSSYGQTCIRLTTWPCYLDLWPLKRIFRRSVNWPSDLSTSKRGHVSPLSWASFLPANFQLPTPFHSRLNVRHGTNRWTNRRTDKPMGLGITKQMNIVCPCERYLCHTVD